MDTIPLNDNASQKNAVDITVTDGSSEFERENDLDEMPSNIAPLEEQRSATGPHKTTLPDLVNIDDSKDDGIIFDSGYKFSLQNIIEQGPNEFSGDKKNFFENVPWSRTTHLPSALNSFIDEDKLDTPAFPGSHRVKTKKPMEVVEEE